MGYLTKYNLTWASNEKDNPTDDQINQALSAITDGYFCSSFSLEQNFEQPMKWYDHRSDIYKLSLYFPKVNFLLEGMGEDREDLWRLYAQNGYLTLSQAEITFRTPQPITIPKED